MSFLQSMLVALLALPAALQGQTDALARDYTEACRLDSLGKHAKAIVILDRLEADPAWRYKAVMRRGSARFALKEPMKALEDLTLATRLEPDSMAPYLNRGSMYLELGMPERSLADIEEGLRRCRSAKDSASALMNKGATLTHVRRFEEALRAYDHSLVLRPEDAATLMNKASVLDDLGREAEAREILLGLHAATPDDVYVINNLGFHASNRDDHAEALRWFEKALVLRPDDPIVLNNLSYAQLRTGAVDKALQNAQRSIKLYPANSYAHRNLGLIWLEKGEKDKACAALEEALRRGFTEMYGPEAETLRRTRCAP